MWGARAARSTSLRTGWLRSFELPPLPAGRQASSPPLPLPRRTQPRTIGLALHPQIGVPHVSFSDSGAGGKVTGKAAGPQRLAPAGPGRFHRGPIHQDRAGEGGAAAGREAAAEGPGKAIKCWQAAAAAAGGRPCRAASQRQGRSRLLPSAAWPAAAARQAALVALKPDQATKHTPSLVPLRPPRDRPRSFSQGAVLHLAYHCSIEGAPKRACVRRYVGARSAWRPLGCLGLSQGAAAHLGLQLAGSTPVLSFQDVGLVQRAAVLSYA